MGTGSYFDKALSYTNGDLIQHMRHTMGHTKYDTIVGTGLSGTIFAARVGPGLGKKFAVVRKPNDGSHGGLQVEGHVGKRFIFVDDFICSGDTLKRVLKAMAKRYPDAEFVGAYLYESEKFQNVDDLSYCYGSWVREISMGPEMGPLTREATLRKNPYADMPLKCPVNGWAYNVLNKITPSEDRRRLEVGFPDSYGRPTIYDMDNCARLTCENPKALPLIEEVEKAAQNTGVSLRRLAGTRMNQLPNTAPEAPIRLDLPKVNVQALADFNQKIYEAEQEAFRKMASEPGNRPFLSA